MLSTLLLLCLSTPVPPAQGVPATAAPVQLRLQSPTRLALLPSGALCVSDYLAGEVVLMRPAGLGLLSRFDVGGRPLAIGTLGDKILVGDETAKQVRIFHADGTPAGVLGGTQVESPTDLATDELAQRVFVVDALAKHVKVFDTSVPGGQLVATIGAPGATTNTFQNPTGIALDPVNQEVYVGDFGNLGGYPGARVVVFGYDGSYHDHIWGKGGPTGQYFARPQGLALGSKPGHVFVVDSWRGEVVVMDRASKTQVGFFGGYGKEKGALLLPLDAVIIGPNHDLFVTSNRSGRVELYAKGGAL